MKRKEIKKTLLKIRDGFYINAELIDCIVFVDKHPTNNTPLEKAQYCIFFKRNSHYTWALLSVEEFENNIKPFI